MTKENIALRKLDLLMRSINEVNRQDETLEELKAAAFEVLLLHPGSEQSDWSQILVEQYGTEVVDAYGNNPNEVFADLANLWKTSYCDLNTGLEYTFNQWAEAFATEASVQMYYDIIEKMKKNV